MERRRIFNYVTITLNCLTAGSVFTFPLFSPPFARALDLTNFQTSAVVSSAILGQYASAVLWGSIGDTKGPGVLSLYAAVLYGGGYGLLGWRYITSVQMEEVGRSQWIWLSFYYFVVGCATSASYFGSIIASTKSSPARHSGLAIGIPCSIFGISPLFLSALASFFTSPAVSLDRLENNELDPGRWLLFLAGLLFIVNGIGAFGLRVIPWDEKDDYAKLPAESLQPASEETPLIPTTTTPSTSQSMTAFVSQPTFWLFGLVILLSIGPAEMAMASLGGIVESLLGVHTTDVVRASSPSTDRVFSTFIDASLGDTAGLELRRKHVQVISVANTFSRLAAGGLSDWLSYSRPPLSTLPPTMFPSTYSQKLASYFRRPPKVSRLFFVLVACTLLFFAFGYTALFLEQPAGLWVLSISTGLSYGAIFTLSPSVVRSVWPLEDFGRNWGLISWFSAVGALIFTPLFGFLGDRAAAHQQSEVCYGRECWETIFLLSSGSCLLASGMVVLLWSKYWRGTV